MKKFLYRFLIVVLAFGMLTPAWITKMWSPTKAEAASSLIIVDNTSGGFSKTGSWHVRNNSSGYGGSFFIENDDEDLAEPPRTATWEPTITVDGLYQVYVHWSAKDDRGTEVQYQVNYSDGVDTAIIDQTKKSDGSDAGSPAVASGWKLLGSYNFIAGTSGNVSLIESANGKTTADAAKFVHTNVLPAAPALSSPVDGLVTKETSVNFLWSASTDSDDIILTYDFELYKNSVLDLVNSRSGLNDPYLTVSPLTDGNYTWRARAFDGEGYSLWSNFSSFVIDNQSPVIASITGNTANIGEFTTIVVNATDNIAPVSAKIALDGGPWVDMVGAASPFTYAVSIPVSITPITYYVKVFDAAGNWAQSDEQTITIVDTRPVISDQSVINVTSTTATINWTTAGHASTSRVVYDTTSHSVIGSAPNYGYAFSTVEDPSLVESHSVIITGLTPGVTYYYRTISHGSPEAVSDEKSFTTLPKIVTAVATTSTTVVSQSETSQVLTPSVTTPSTTSTTTPTEQGQIKGAQVDENQESEKINWTPWIILFILIILAGAATGGYFYWFGRDDDEEIISKEVIEKNDKSIKKNGNGKTAKIAPKKNKRW